MNGLIKSVQIFANCHFLFIYSFVFVHAKNYNFTPSVSENMLKMLKYQLAQKASVMEAKCIVRMFFALLKIVTTWPLFFYQKSSLYVNVVKPQLSLCLRDN